jgi:glutamate transport system permease protein
MTAPVLADALGPRARRRVAIFTALAAVVLAAVLGFAIKRFADHDQLSWERWKYFTQWSVIRFLLEGLWATLKVAAVSMVLAATIGTILALGRLSRTAPVRWLAGAWVQFFRGLPVFLLILFSAQGLPDLGLRLDVFWYVVIGLVAYNGAVLGEIFRAGILSLDRGQSEAAHAIGLSYWQAMGFVLIPQAVRRMVPAIVSQLVTVLKDSSLGAYVAYEELFRRGQLARGSFGERFLQALVVVALMYIIVCFALSRVAQRLEVRQRRRLKADPIAVAGVEDLTAVAVAADAKV